MQLPLEFEAALKADLGDEWIAFLQSLEQEVPVSIRYNPGKPVSNKPGPDTVKWCKDGVYLKKRPSFTLDPTFHAGAYYVQEASSMFLAEVVRQCVPNGQRVLALDLCAAPGGKSTLLASYLNPDSLLLANEVIRSRYSVLQQNLQKWGFPGTHISNHDSADFEQLEGFFDLILTDAPCSGEGLFRKDKKAIKEWSPENVQLCSARQRRILGNTFNSLKPGGILIYSTCTYNHLENQSNVEWILQNTELEQLRLEIPGEWGIVEKEWGYQFYPHKVRGEGFFISVFRKKEGIGNVPINKKSKSKTPEFKNLSRIPKKQVELLNPWIDQPERFDFFQKPGGGILAILKSQVLETIQLSQVLNRFQAGTEIGQFKNKDFIPTHALALSTMISKEVPKLELSREEALLYLKRENLLLDTSEKGWHVVTHQGLNLGWVKILANRVNNYLPKEWRIRMDINPQPFQTYR